MVVNLADAHLASRTGRNTLLKLKLFAVDVDMKVPARRLNGDDKVAALLQTVKETTHLCAPAVDALRVEDRVALRPTGVHVQKNVSVGNDVNGEFSSISVDVSADDHFEVVGG